MRTVSPGLVTTRRRTRCLALKALHGAENPLANLEALRHPLGVMVRGHYLPIAD